MVKAAVIKEYGVEKFDIEDLPMPEVEPDDLILKIKLASICGSDIHKFKGEWYWPTPIIPGHEATGEIYKIGENVKTDWIGRPLTAGDRLVYSSYWHCGRCFYCTKGDPTMCVNRKQLGGSLTCDKPPYLNGAYAEFLYLRAPFPRFKAPDDLSFEALAPINCACATIVFGVEKIGGIKSGDHVVVLGTGGLGFYAISYAKALGASRIIATDLIEKRLKLAEEFGADYTINIKEYENPEDRINKVLELANEGYGADIIIDVTGHSSSVIPEGVQMLRKAGRYLEIGGDGNMQSNAPVVASNFVPNSKTITGVRNFSASHLLQSLHFITNHRDDFPFEKIISHKFRLDKVNEAIKFAQSGEPIRVGLEP
ncbi:MAG: zinc-binding dehydrogenase [Promethearchaeota archaeon]